MKICRFVIKLNKELKIGMYKYICIQVFIYIIVMLNNLEEFEYKLVDDIIVIGFML